MRLDELLFSRNLASSITKAQALIIAGQIEVNSRLVTKSGTPVDTDSSILVKLSNPYVSRGGLKLEGAIAALGIEVKGRVCFDIGASTGGFTDCLLKHGASKVYAIDVGAGLLDQKLRTDPRVENIETVNFRYFSNNALKSKIEFVTIDVSFISLDKILPQLTQYLSHEAEILLLVKPQFELLPNEMTKGVVRVEAFRQKAIDKIRSFAQNIGFKLLGEIDSSIKGPKGNLEHFIWFCYKS